MELDKMDLNQLYAVYGELLIQGEILNAKILDCKKRIAEKLNSSQLPVAIKEQSE